MNFKTDTENVIAKMITRLIELNNQLNEGVYEDKTTQLLQLIDERYNLIITIQSIVKYTKETTLPVGWELLGLKFSSLEKI
jgi:vacuolar-type H+-ATPase subunit B/Vma2